MRALPPSHILLSLTSSNIPPSRPPHIPTSLTAVLPSTSTYVPNAPPWARIWSHPRCILLPSHPFPGLSQDRLSIFIYPLYLADHPSACFLIYRGPDLIASQSHSEPTLLRSLFRSLTVASGLCLAFERLPTFFYIPSSLATSPLFSLRKHSYLTFSTALTDSLTSLLDDDEDLVIRFSSFLAKKPKKAPHDLTSRPFSTSWPGIRPDALTPFLRPSTTRPTPPPQTPAVAAFASWAADYSVEGRSPAWKACAPSQGPSYTIPFLEGVLPIASRRLLCACMQLLFDHAFTATYSDRFRPSAGDNTDCPCGRRYITRDGISLPFRNTLHHGLFHCHDRDDAREAHLPFTSLDAIFTSARGGAALCRYIHASQAFLRPTPPRPDPP